MEEPDIKNYRSYPQPITPATPVIIAPPLLKLKILGTLKSNDYDGLKETVDSIKTASNQYELGHIKDSILNLAVQVASTKFIQALLSEEVLKELDIDINHQDSEGNTPLHLVALSNRIDVAELLLKNERIDDTILNNSNKQAIELTKDLRMISLMQEERAKYVEVIAVQFKNAFSSHDFAALETILSNGRSYQLLDINGYDPETGDTVLHEFVKKNDMGMVKWILNHGGDPFKRDKRGKLPIELVAKTDEGMKKILRDASQDQSVIEPTSKSNGSLQAPTYKGYLRKWTNYASGYKLRWFVLDANGVLSYYKNQEDTNNACRGSLNMGSAILHLDSSEALKFEIISKGGDRWHLKGNHPVETNRWVWSLQGSIRFAKDRVKAMKLVQDQVMVRSSSSTAQQSLKIIESTPSVEDATHFETSGVSQHNQIKRNTSYHTENAQNSDADAGADDDDDDDDDNDDDSHTDSDDDFDLEDNSEISVYKNRFKIELGYFKDLILELQSIGTLRELNGSPLKEVNSLIDGFARFEELVTKRDTSILKALQKQKNINELWIDSVKELENELISKSAELDNFENERRQIKKALNRRQGASAPTLSRIASTTTNNDGLEEFEDSEEKATEPVFTSTEEVDANDEISRIIKDVGDSDDEFFDADEFGEDDEDEPNIDDLTLRSVLTRKTTLDDEFETGLDYFTDIQKEKAKLLELEGSFKGYEEPFRENLDLKVDDRPKLSLWGILKSMIGKDITKITLPVSFNEPTSFLQRCAEDLEYNYILDKAAQFEDSTLRLLYIAAFAASPYSSTINRVAKPFNPLLGETFEYSRPDYGYRCFTEQVSHQPPVSAIIAESAKWDYYGETPVKSGFNGRSFDVTPTATWYLHMRPDSEDEEEIYSWKKLTTSVIGIMVGSPSIDNYGEMIITNHKTGDQAVVTFKPRGWSGKTAYELTGVVSDGQGNKQWAIGGHWDSKIYGKKIIQNDLTHIDYSNKKVETEPNQDGLKFLMWQVSSRPVVPFNLTSYAITLNATQPSLKEWLSPSDSRLRPDQRAMEDGKYDDASELKTSVENKQRAARKEREENGVIYEPNFFVKDVHESNGEVYWRYNGTYWKFRNEKSLPNIDIFV